MAMNKKRFIVVIIIAGLLLPLVGMQFADMAKAQPAPYNLPPLPYVGTYSPTNLTIYYESTSESIEFTIPLNAYVFTNGEKYSGNTALYETVQSLDYSIDGVSFPFLNWTFPPGLNFDNMYPFVTIANATLTNLDVGFHYLFLYGETTFGSYFNSTVIFYIAAYGEVLTTFPPLPTVQPTIEPFPTFPVRTTSPSLSPSPTLSPSPSPTPSPSPSPFPTQQPTLEPRSTPTLDIGGKVSLFYEVVLVIVLIILLAIICLPIYFLWRRINAK
jgi:hypothetical protein